MIYDNLKEELNTSLKNRDQLRVDVLRLLISAIKNEEIELRGQGKTLQDEDVLRVFAKQAKQRRESIEMFKAGNRQDLVEAETTELAIIEGYLPKQLSDEEIESKVKEVALELGDQANFGSVMKQSMAELKGQADGKVVSAIVKKYYP